MQRHFIAGDKNILLVLCTYFACPRHLSQLERLEERHLQSSVRKSQSLKPILILLLAPLKVEEIDNYYGASDGCKREDRYLDSRRNKETSKESKLKASTGMPRGKGNLE